MVGQKPVPPSVTRLGAMWQAKRSDWGVWGAWSVDAERSVEVDGQQQQSSCWECIEASVPVSEEGGPILDKSRADGGIDGHEDDVNRTSIPVLLSELDGNPSISV